MGASFAIAKGCSLIGGLCDKPFQHVGGGLQQLDSTPSFSTLLDRDRMETFLKCGDFCNAKGPVRTSRIM